MDTFLLDTSVVSVLYDSRRPNHQAVRKAIAGFDRDAPQLISAITIGELRYGLTLSKEAGQPMTHIEACIERAEEHPLAEIGRYTGQAFAQVKSSIAIQRVDVRRRIPRWVVGWADRVTGQMLQIDENDLWIAAQAVERNFVIVTSDRDFVQVIGAAVQELRITAL